MKGSTHSAGLSKEEGKRSAIDVRLVLMTAFRPRAASRVGQAVELGWVGSEPCRVPQRPQRVGSPMTRPGGGGGVSDAT